MYLPCSSGSNKLILGKTNFAFMVAHFTNDQENEKARFKINSIIIVIIAL